MNDHPAARPPDSQLREVAFAAAQRAGVPAELLNGYLPLVDTAAGTGRLPRRDELDSCRALGAGAAERGVPLRSLVEAYLIATELAWDRLPAIADAATAAELRGAGRAVLAAASRAVAALADGYDSAQRLAVRREETARQDFIDDLLAGRRGGGGLAERAQRFGVPLAAAHVVAVARSPNGFAADDPITAQVDLALVTRFGAANVLVAARDGMLVCILPASLRGGPGEFAHHLLTTLSTEGNWQVGVGRPHSGPGGVLRSYQEARDTLELADRLGFRAPVLNAADLLVFPVLLRDRVAITDLVLTVLGPLEQARGGPGPLLDTLSALFTSHGNNTAAARRLGVNVRTVSYRLERVRRLTGYAPDEPMQRFTLEAAVLGARLLDWPNHPLGSR